MTTTTLRESLHSDVETNSQTDTSAFQFWTCPVSVLECLHDFIILHIATYTAQHHNYYSKKCETYSSTKMVHLDGIGGFSFPFFFSEGSPLSRDFDSPSSRRDPVETTLTISIQSGWYSPLTIEEIGVCFAIMFRYCFRFK